MPYSKEIIDYIEDNGGIEYFTVGMLKIFRDVLEIDHDEFIQSIIERFDCSETDAEEVAEHYSI